MTAVTRGPVARGLQEGTLEKQDVIAALGALAHESRLDVYRSLVRAGNAGASPGSLSHDLGIPSATLSFHLKELRNARLVCSERQGRSLLYRADFDTMRAVLAYLTENCCVGDVCN